MEGKTVKMIIPESKEISTLRHSDGIPYMDYEEFKIKYPHDPKERISGDNKYVIKSFKISEGIDFPIELNAYSSFEHPCILKPKAWSGDDENFYMVSKRGKNISYAFNDKDITIEEIISDIMSAIAFLNTNGYIHGDIKPGNMVFHKGKAKLIDMGSFVKAKLNSDKQYYIKDKLYTYMYRDPEYTEEQWTNIKCEIYSLAISIKEILEQEIPYFGSLYGYKTGISHLDWFFEEASKFIEERKDINYLMNNSPEDLIVRRYTGNVFTIPINKKRKNCDKRAIIVMSWMVEISYLHDFDSEALFLCLHLIYRLFDKINKKFDKPNDILQLFGCVCLNLAINVISSGYMPVSEWFDLTNQNEEDREKFKLDYIDMLTIVLELSRGIISTLTYWDYAGSAEDLKDLLYDMVNCSYNPFLIREVFSGGNKCITVRQFLSKEDIKIYRGKPYPELKEKITEGNNVSPLPCELDLKSDVEAIEKKWDILIRLTDINIHEYFPVLMHNRKSLVNLSEDAIRNVYRSIFELGRNPNYRLLTDKLMTNVAKEGDNWRTVAISVNSMKYNPFK